MYVYEYAYIRNFLKPWVVLRSISLRLSVSYPPANHTFVISIDIKWFFSPVETSGCKGSSVAICEDPRGLTQFGHFQG